jgi:hypothetical protein
VTGYRAPSFSIDARTPWAHEVLAQAGYAYSSSVAPIVHDHYGWREAPRLPSARCRSAAAGNSGNDGGTRRAAHGGRGWRLFRLLPYGVSAWAIRQSMPPGARRRSISTRGKSIPTSRARIARRGARAFATIPTCRSWRQAGALVRDFAWGRMDEVAAGEAAWPGIRRASAVGGGMNAPFRLAPPQVREAGRRTGAYARFLAGQALARCFTIRAGLTPWRGQRPCQPPAAGRAGGVIVAALPLHAVSSPLFGRALVSTGFAVGGVMAKPPRRAGRRRAGSGAAAAQPDDRTARRHSAARAGWHVKQDSHAGFVCRWRPTMRRSCRPCRASSAPNCARGWPGLEVRTGSSAQDRAWHYRVYSESVRNLGTPVFPAPPVRHVLDAFGEMPIS